MTLEEVIIDYGSDKEKKIPNFLQFGSFYVALTRVKNGEKVFLKSWDPSFIVKNETLSTKVDAFCQLNKYKMKKIYLDEQVFQNEELEVKVGYHNINGLMDAMHGEYLNQDRNLRDLDLLVVAETKLTSSYSDDDIEKVLSRWKIFTRYDAPDGKHMGLILLIPRLKFGQINPFITSFTELPLWKNNQLQIQGLSILFRGDDGGDEGLNIGFIYCRQTPTQKECEAISRAFARCHLLLGDFNLSPSDKEDKKKLDMLCSDTKFLALQEITRISSSKQLDHILGKQVLKDQCYCTSYLSFNSDHKVIVARVATGTSFSQNFLERSTFSEDKHLPPLISQEGKRRPRSSYEDNPSSHKKKKVVKKSAHDKQIFQRSFKNPDASTCWLNSCLQLIMAAMDHFPDKLTFNSPLGLELIKLKNHATGIELNPTKVKDILVAQENARRIENPNAINILNLANGQQCVRDMFVCLTENLDYWPDVFSFFCVQINEETQCGNSACNHINSTDQV